MERLRRVSSGTKMTNVCDVFAARRVWFDVAPEYWYGVGVA